MVFEEHLLVEHQSFSHLLVYMYTGHIYIFFFTAE